MRKFAILIALLLFLGLQAVHAQSKVITGKVSSKEDGSSLPGVTVMVKGTTIGTTSDIDGTYLLDVPADAKVLVFSFVGMKPLEVAIGATSKINAVLEADVLNIEGVVVTAIGIKRETKALGYSVQEVGTEELNRTQNTNVVNSLSGKVAGVQVTSSSGAAGGSSYITIRGQASIGGNNQPLFIVDGVPINNDQLYSGNPDDGRNNLNEGVAFSNRAIDINPDDIATVSVLKGGAATALYGLRAANGAIIITTKKGVASKGKKINVTFNSSFSIDQVNKLPEMQSKYGQGYGGNYFDPSTGMSLSWGPLLDTMYWDGATDYDYDKNGMLVGQSDPTAKTKMEPYDNINNFYRTGFTFNNSLSLSGGDQKATYYFSMSDMKSNGIIPGNDYRKTTVKLAGETQLYKKVKVTGSANYIKSGGDRIQQGSNLSGVMLGLLRTPPSFDNANGYDDPLNEPLAYSFPDGSQRNYRGGGGYDNPWWTVNKNILTDDVNRIIGNFSTIYTPLDWMTVTYRLGNDWFSDRRKGHFAIGSRNYPGGQVTEDHHFLQDINSDLIVNMRKDFSEDLKSNITVGQNMYSHYYQQTYMQGDGLTIPDFYHMSNAGSAIARESIERKRTAAFYGDIGLDYKNMLFLNITGRNEWSTSLPEGENSFFYPSFSGGFIFTELPMLKDNEILPFGKLRASYAIIANDAAIYGTKTYYQSSSFGDGWTTGIAYPFMGTPGFEQQNALGNTTLKPEKMKSFEIGADLKFWKNRFGLDVSYYNNTNEDLLLWVPIAASSGFIQQLMNAATMENKGIEILFRATPIKKKDFQWDILLNWTKNKNMVVELAEGVENFTLGGFTDPGIRAVAGKPYGSVYGTQWLKDASGNIVIQDDPNEWNFGYPIMDTEEGELGSIQPDWTGGITNELTYKNFKFSFLIDIKEGGIMWNGTRGAMYYFGTHKDTEDRDAEKVFEGVKGHLDANGNLVSTGAANDVTVPLGQAWYVDGEGSGFTGPAEQFIEETSWIRLREVYLSYNFSPDFLQKTFIQTAEVYFSGRNLWLSTDYNGIDPETSLYGAHNAQGMDYFNMPNTKTYTFGIKLAF